MFGVKQGLKLPGLRYAVKVGLVYLLLTFSVSIRPLVGLCHGMEDELSRDLSWLLGGPLTFFGRLSESHRRSSALPIHSVVLCGRVSKRLAERVSFCCLERLSLSLQASRKLPCLLV